MKLLINLMCLVWLTFGVIHGVGAIPIKNLFEGQDIVVDDKLFSDWKLDFLEFSSLPGPDFSQIEVLPVFGALEAGLEYVVNNQLTTTGEDYIFFDFEYTVQVLAPKKYIVDNTLELVSYQFASLTNPPGGFLEIDEYPNGMTKTVEVDPSHGINKPYDQLNFPPVKSLHVVTRISVAGDVVGDKVALNLFRQTFSQQIPEPSTLSLFWTVLCISILARVVGRKSS